MSSLILLSELPSYLLLSVNWWHIQRHRTATLDAVITVTLLVILQSYFLHVCCTDPAVNTNLRPSSSLAQPNGPVRHLSPCEAGLGITYWDQHYSPSWQGLCAVGNEDVENWMQTGSACMAHQTEWRGICAASSKSELLIVNVVTGGTSSTSSNTLQSANFSYA